MSDNIGFRIVVEHICYDMISEKSFHDEFDCNPRAAYAFLSDDFGDNVLNFSSEENILSIEVLPGYRLVDTNAKCVDASIEKVESDIKKLITVECLVKCACCGKNQHIYIDDGDRGSVVQQIREDGWQAVDGELICADCSGL